MRYDVIFLAAQSRKNHQSKSQTNLPLYLVVHNLFWILNFSFRNTACTACIFFYRFWILTLLPLPWEQNVFSGKCFFFGSIHGLSEYATAESKFCWVWEPKIEDILQAWLQMADSSKGGHAEPLWVTARERIRIPLHEAEQAVHCDQSLTWHKEPIWHEDDWKNSEIAIYRHIMLNCGKVNKDHTELQEFASSTFRIWRHEEIVLMHNFGKF